VQRKSAVRTTIVDGEYLLADTEDRQSSVADLDRASFPVGEIGECSYGDFRHGWVVLVLVRFAICRHQHNAACASS
jgi:hypothetical protein